MICRDAAERVTALVDGELPPAEREELERHFSACDACRRARAAEEAVAARLRAAPRPPLPAGFSASVMAKVGAGPAAARPAGRILPLWPLFAAAAAVAAAVVAMVAIGPGVQRGAAPGRPVWTAAAPPAPKMPTSPPTDPAPPAEKMNERLDREEGRASNDAGDRAAGTKSEDAPGGPPEAALPAAALSGAAGPAPAPGAPPPPVEEPASSVGLLKASEEGVADKKESKKSDSIDGAEDAEGARRDTAKDADDERRKAGFEAPAPTRIALQYRVPVLADAQQSVEGTLLANRGLATRGGTWKAPVVGEVRQDQSRVLVLQVRPGNLEKLRAALDRAAGLKDSTVELLARGEVLPPEVARLMAGGVFRGAKGADLAGGKEKARAAKGPAPVPSPVPPVPPVPPAGLGAGPGAGGGGSEESDAGPPPMPSAEQLKKLAESPAPSKEGPTTTEGEGAEVLVEIQLETVPPAGGK